MFNYKTSVVSLNEQNKSDFTVYTNPINSTVSITGLEQNDIVTLRDISGKVVFTEHVQFVSPISVESVSNGMYFLSVERDNQVLSTQQVVVQHN